MRVFILFAKLAKFNRQIKFFLLTLSRAQNQNEENRKVIHLSNAGGKLAKLKDAPEDMDLMTALVGKAMAIKVKIWDMNGKTGNWISAVAPTKQQAPQGANSSTNTPYTTTKRTQSSKI